MRKLFKFGLVSLALSLCVGSGAGAFALKENKKVFPVEAATPSDYAVRVWDPMTKDYAYFDSLSGALQTYRDKADKTNQFVFDVAKSFTDPGSASTMNINFKIDLHGYTVTFSQSMAAAIIFRPDTYALTAEILSSSSGGKITGSFSNSTILLGADTGSGIKTRIGDGVTIENNGSAGRGIASHTTSQLGIQEGATIIGDGYGLYTTGGAIDVNGHITSRTSYAIYVNGTVQMSLSGKYAYSGTQLSSYGSLAEIYSTKLPGTGSNYFALYCGTKMTSVSSLTTFAYNAQACDVSITFATNPSTSSLVVRNVPSAAIGNKFTVTNQSDMYSLFYSAGNMTYQLNQYTVSYDNNGGSGTIGAGGIVEHGTSITLPDPHYKFFAPTNKRFVEWNTSPDGSGTSKNIGDSYTVTSDVTFYAIWEYTVKGNIENDVTTRSSLSYHYHKDDVGNFTFTNLYVRFGGIITKGLWDALDAESVILGYGELYSTASYLSANQLRDYYATAESNDNIDKHYYELTSDPESYPVLFNDSNYQGVTDDYYVWNIRRSVAEANFTDVYASVAFIVTENDGVVFMNEVRKSIKNLAQDLIDGPDYDNESLDGSLAYLASL